MVHTGTKAEIACLWHESGQRAEIRDATVMLCKPTNNPSRSLTISHFHPLHCASLRSVRVTSIFVSFKTPSSSDFRVHLAKMADYASIAQQFVEFYYNTFDNSRPSLANLYVCTQAHHFVYTANNRQREGSMLTFENSSVQGAPNIIEKLNVQTSHALPNE
jgi:Nuclear transport factor 2 (NTF2) domain